MFFCALLLLCAAPAPAGRGAVRNEAEVIAAIRAGLRDYAGRITIRFACLAEDLDAVGALADAWVEAALEETDDAREGDYIRCQYGGYTRTCSRAGSDGQTAWTVELVPRHYIYYVQEQQVGEALPEVYRALALPEGASEYEKLRALYGFVCTHVRYDEVHRKNPYYHAKSTAYAALLRRRAACQGCCALLYRMLRENGIACRVVRGMAESASGTQLHAWLIARLDGRWYCLDPTWDAGAEEYQWFLRGSAGFARHTPLEEFRAAEFVRRYPIALEDYAAPR